MSCLTEDELVQLAEGALPEAAASSARQHLVSCERCRTVVSELERSLSTFGSDTAPRAEAAPLARGTELGRYIVLKRLGMGGMGVVYSAYDPTLDRRVALKLLTAEASLSEAGGPGRLLQEAQSLAQLSHPNVVAIHDVGSWNGQVFLAMELLGGGTLKAWLKEERRSWRQVLAVFQDAGRGLIAAHAAGLVHRDFKPDNVLFGADGRVRVTDFGLARSARLLPATGQRDLRSPALSVASAVAGTPAYMAPEQLKGLAVDPKTDQFSFAVALYEGLYGERPFAGASSNEAMLYILLANVRPAPARTAVPVWVRRILLRALSADPSQRYPTMEALLDALGRDPARARRRWLAVGATAALLVAGGVGARAYQRRQSLICKGAGRAWDGVWDSAQRAAVQEAFLASHKAFAAGAFDGAAQTLDRYADQWSAMHIEACEATRLRGELSESVLERRMICLDQRRKQVHALVGVFLKPDGPVIERAVQAAQSLPPLDACADLQALASAGRAPPAPAIRAQVDALRDSLAQANALRLAGKYAEGLEPTARVAAAARSLGYRPLEAEALWLKGQLQQNSGRFPEAEATLREAAQIAEASGDDELLGYVWNDLAFVVGDRLARADDGEQWVRYAQSVVDRLGGNDELQARVFNNLGAIQARAGKYDAALASYRASVELRERKGEPESLQLARTLNNMGLALSNEDAAAEAVEMHRRALKIFRSQLGDNNPTVGDSLNNLALSLQGIGRWGEAEQSFRKVLAIYDKNLEPTDPSIAMGLGNLCGAESTQGKYSQAIADCQRGLALYRKALPSDTQDVGDLLNALGWAYRQAHDLPQAQVYLEQGLAVRERVLGKDHPAISTSLENLVMLYLDQKLLPKALATADRDIAVVHKMGGDGGLGEAGSRTTLAEVYLALGDSGRAVTELERAVAIESTKYLDSNSRAQTQWAMARALWGAGQDKARAIDFATKAAAGFASPDDQAEVNRWLAERRPVSSK